MGDAVSAATSAVGSLTGGAIGGLTNGIANGVVPNAQIADQSRINDQINALQKQTADARVNQTGEQQYANDQYANVNQRLGTADNYLANAQGLNQGPNVQNAIGLLQTQANGSAPSAAEGVLQQGTDQALATQAALANSGNISQQISGQKNAMDNAANIVQTSANQASQLRANQQQVGQQNYAVASQQQANQAGVNANSATNIANANNVLNQTQQNAALQYAQLGNTTATNAGNLGVGGAGLAQGALSQQQGQKAQVSGGLLNGVGGAAAGLFGGGGDSGGELGEAAGAAALFSDENSKKNILLDTPESMKAAKEIKEAFLSSDKEGKCDVKKDSMLHKFLDHIDSVTYEYKKPDGKMGKTPGTHMGIIAQNVEKAPGGKSMVIDTPKGKAIDVASAVGTLLSAAADAHDRISTIEELFKARKGAKK